MKISEKLSEIKQKEGQLMRLYNLRDTFAKQSFREEVIVREKDSTKELEKKQKEFIKNKAERFAKVTNDIEKLKNEIVETKNKINRKNVESSVDRRLAEMKYLRLELSKLMNLIKKDSYTDKFIDIDLWQELGLANRIKELETKKSKLDAEIQSINWSTEI